MAPSSFFSSLWTSGLIAMLAFTTGVHSDVAATPGATVSSTILIIARDQASAMNNAYLGLQGYGIPYEVITIPQSGGSLPVLNSTTTTGHYGGIVIVGDVAYNYNNSYYSALTRRQWYSLYDYQTAFGVRMVRLDVFPTTDYGVSSLGGNAKDEPVTITNATGFPTANLKTNQKISIGNYYHTPAKITNSSIAWEVAKFGDVGSAAVINQLGGRQQMAWFMGFALDWSSAATILQHTWIHWMTRGLYVGFRRIYFSTQVDDMFLETPLYRPQGQSYRCKPDDLYMHIDWQVDINKRLPSGSEFYIEIGHNGNGDIEAATDTSDGARSCSPNSGIEYPDQADGWYLEYAKPIGSGTDIWPATPTKYGWSLDCAEIDELENFFSDTDNRDQFAHISHTFTHEDLTNATYADTAKEISWNQVWLKQVGLDSAKRFSPKGIIPPAITGLHNGDALKAWLDNGIVNVVGDNTRPVLYNKDNRFWPLNTTVAANGYDGVLIMPRWATVIYYNCDLPACTLQEWIDTSGGKGTIDDLLTDAKNTAIRNLMGLHWAPYMFHQANLRVNDVPDTSVNGKKGQYSLLMTWTEVVATEMIRLSSWPFKTIKHDDLATQYVNRRTRDQCRPSLTYRISSDGTKIESVNVYTAGGNKCGTTIPITVPTTVQSTSGATKEQVGSDPLTLWVTMSGASRSYTFSSPIPI